MKHIRVVTIVDENHVNLRFEYFSSSARMEERVAFRTRVQQFTYKFMRRSLEHLEQGYNSSLEAAWSIFAVCVLTSVKVDTDGAIIDGNTW